MDRQTNKQTHEQINTKYLSICTKIAEKNTKRLIDSTSVCMLLKSETYFN